MFTTQKKLHLRSNTAEQLSIGNMADNQTSHCILITSFILHQSQVVSNSIPVIIFYKIMLEAVHRGHVSLIDIHLLKNIVHPQAMAPYALNIYYSKMSFRANVYNTTVHFTRGSDSKNTTLYTLKIQK